MKKFKILKIIGIFLTVVILIGALYQTLFVFYAEYEYPISQLNKIKYPHIDLVRIENNWNLTMTETTIGEKRKNFNNIIKHRKVWAKEKIEIAQVYIDKESGYRPYLFTGYMKLYSSRFAERFMYPELYYFIWGSGAKEYQSDSFDKCTIEEFSGGFRVAVQKKRQVIYLEYIGNLPKETFLNELARIL
jgi:hypothetical protein